MLKKNDGLRLVMLAILFVAAGRLLAREEGSTRPNIILIVSDDQGWGDVGYHNNPKIKTPHLDSMAAGGLRLEQFYAAGPNCSPTRASILTGRTHNRSKVVQHGRYMRPEEETIGEALKRANYVTAHFGKWHVGSVQPESPVCPGNSGFDEWITGLNFFDLDPYISDNGIAKQFKGESSALVMDWTLDFIHKHAASENPFLALTWFPAPHSPHKSFDPDDDRYGEPQKGKMGYYKEITTMDDQIGRLREELRTLGIHENTLIWFCSDNGGLQVATSGGRGKKGCLYEGGLRVPCIVEWPGHIQPAESHFPSVTSDIYPTLLELTGLKPDHSRPLDGISLMPVLKGNAPEKRPGGIGFWFGGFGAGESTKSDEIIKKMMKAQQAGISPPLPDRVKKDIEEFPQFSETDFPGHSVWLEWPWKLHRIGQKGTFELYNLVEDAMETTNVAADHPEVLDAMRIKLDAWQSSVTHSLNGKDY